MSPTKSKYCEMEKKTGGGACGRTARDVSKPERTNGSAAHSKPAGNKGAINETSGANAPFAPIGALGFRTPLRLKEICKFESFESATPYCIKHAGRASETRFGLGSTIFLITRRRRFASASSVSAATAARGPSHPDP